MALCFRIFYPIGGVIALIAIGLSLGCRYYMFRKARQRRELMGVNNTGPATVIPMSTAPAGYSQAPPQPTHSTGSSLPSGAYPRQQAAPAAYTEQPDLYQQTKYQTEYGPPPTYNSATT